MINDSIYNKTFCKTHSKELTGVPIDSINLYEIVKQHGYNDVETLFIYNYFIDTLKVKSINIDGRLKYFDLKSKKKYSIVNQWDLEKIFKNFKYINPYLNLELINNLIFKADILDNQNSKNDIIQINNNFINLDEEDYADVYFYYNNKFYITKYYYINSKPDLTNGFEYQGKFYDYVLLDY